MERLEGSSRRRRGRSKPGPGSLFPALHRLEEKEWLSSEWGESENKRRAKYYRLTAAGRAAGPRHETLNWERIAVAIARALATA